MGATNQTTGGGASYSCPVCNQPGIQSAGLGPLDFLPILAVAGRAKNVFYGLMEAGNAVGAHIEIATDRKLLDKLANEGAKKVIAGAGHKTTYGEAANLLGLAEQWRYVTSRVAEFGEWKWQAHWAENIVTGARANLKLKAVGWR